MKNCVQLSLFGRGWIGILFLVLVSAISGSAEERELSSNGDFDSSIAASRWTAISRNARPSAGFTSVGESRSSPRHAYVGDQEVGYANSDGSVRQQIEIPERTTSLQVEFYLKIESADSESDAYDFFRVTIRDVVQDTIIRTIVEKDNSDQGTYSRYKRIRESFNASSLAGKTVVLDFSARTDVSQHTTFLIDNVSVEATLEDKQTYTIDIQEAGEGGDVDPEGRRSVSAGSNLTITARPDSGYEVSHWTFNGVSAYPEQITAQVFNINQNFDITVTFRRIVEAFAITLQPTEGGRIEVSPILGSYTNGAVATIAAIPAENYFFAGWTGDLNGIASQRTLTVNRNFNIGARFFLNPPETGFGTIDRENGTVELYPHEGFFYLVWRSTDLLNWEFIRLIESTAIIPQTLFPENSTLNAVYTRVDRVVRSLTAPFLKFPLKDLKPDTVVVNAMQDHHGGYRKDGIIESCWGHQIRLNEGNGFGYFDLGLGLGSELRQVSPDSSSPNYYLRPEFSLIHLTLPAGTPFPNLPFIYKNAASKTFWYDGHMGYDFSTNKNGSSYRTIIAAADGILVREASADCDNTICIEHPEGYRTYYLHCSSFSTDIQNALAARTNLCVKRGETIGTTGGTGCGDKDQAVLGKFPEHLHFSVRRKVETIVRGPNGNRTNISWVLCDPYGRRPNGGSSGDGDVWEPALWLPSTSDQY